MNMETELKQLKSVLRSLVVSSPVEMRLQSLLYDYRNMMGTSLPVAKFGYRDPLLFLKERCGDCFLFQGGPNPVLTPIVPEQLKHIDQFVQKQKVSSRVKFIGKRRSVQESKKQSPTDLIVETFEKSVKTPYSSNQNKRFSPPINREHVMNTDKRREDTQPPDTEKANGYKSTSDLREEDENVRQHESNTTCMEAYKNFIRKRLPVYDSTQNIHNEISFKDSDSGQSSSSSTKQSQLEELKAELRQLVLDSGGVWCSDLMRLYRERYGRELNFGRFGYTSVGALACALSGVVVSREAGGAVRLQPAGAAPAGGPAHPAARHAPPHRDPEPRTDPEDALPWIDFDPDVFPEDCVSFSESIPAPALSGLRAGDNLELMVGEVYSPSHFWFYRLGSEYNIAMEDMMDEMTQYYSTGEGATRVLATGAVRAGHYCSSYYERDWHRSLIVKLVDCDTVKVRHVDYGTVDRVSRAALRPLLRRWAQLPAQAIRARLSGARPAARGRRWPHAAAAAFLRLVQDRRLVGNIAHVDHEENILELFLVDTTSESDVRIDRELIRAGYADPRDLPHAAAPETYLYPVFAALESGDTPNFAEIHAYLRDGIALDFVHEYRRHVPAALPDTPRAASPPAPAPALLDNRVPLFPHAASPARLVASPARLVASPVRLVASPTVESQRPATPAPATASEPPRPAPPAAPAAEAPRRAFVAPASRPRPLAPQPAPWKPTARVPYHVAPQPHPPPPLFPAPSLPYFVFPAPLQPMPPFPFPPYPQLPPVREVYSSLPPQYFPRGPVEEPRAAASPPPPYSARRVRTEAGEVTLSVSECEIFSLLSSLDPNAAHWYIVDAISRARGPRSTAAAGAPRLSVSQSRLSVSQSRLNPEASEFRVASAETQTDPPAAPDVPPGFEGHCVRPRRERDDFIIDMPYS